MTLAFYLPSITSIATNLFNICHTLAEKKFRFYGMLVKVSTTAQKGSTVEN